ncbi:hypothetical protein K435DRAFT_862942 [Dendrothele bispora CBS 962.96]|uniref:F-box domain-containing protein n=1 Tax=Dendrothele bispora (strain CBS 962.96) TaxID=1314807 RepID=A0A4S8LRC7_DENBC|nr:hypothetical protein K435DRAFT_862942 [Dendrothele bispora CBS 962.96]
MSSSHRPPLLPSSTTIAKSHSHLENLPNEILLVVLEYLDVHHILSLRQTCKLFEELTRDRSIWLGILERQRIFPLPTQCYIPGSTHLSSSVLSLSSSSIESLVISNIFIDNSWLVPRQNDPVELSLTPGRQTEIWRGENGRVGRDGGRPLRQGMILMGVEMFLDRWVLGVYADGWLNLWDTNKFVNSTHFPLSPTTSHLEDAGSEAGTYEGWSSCHVSSGTGQDRLTSYTATLDVEKERILIALTKVQLRPSSWFTSLYEVVVPSQSPNSPSTPVFRLLCTHESSASYSLRRIDPFQGMVVFSHLCSVEVMWLPFLHGDDSNEGTDNEKPEILRIPTQCDELEEMYTTIVSLRIIDPYIFVFKSRSIELHPIPPKDGLSRQETSSLVTSSISISLPVLRHDFPNYNFREVHISDAQCHTSPSSVNNLAKTDPDVNIHTTTADTRTYKLSVFASDVIKGLFYFCATVTVPAVSSSSPSQPSSWSYDIEPMLDVKLKAVYAMVDIVPVRSKKRKSKRTSQTSHSNHSSQPSTSVSSLTHSTANYLLGSTSAIPTPTSIPTSTSPSSLFRPQRQSLLFSSQSTHTSATTTGTTNLPHALPPDPVTPHRLLRPPYTCSSFSPSHAIVNPFGMRDSSFVSTFTMGSQGMRAIWIERRRATTIKRVVGCRLSRFEEWDEDDMDDSEQEQEQDGSGNKCEQHQGEETQEHDVDGSSEGDNTVAQSESHDDRGRLDVEKDGSKTMKGQLDSVADSLLPVPLEGKVVYSFQSYDPRGGCPRIFDETRLILTMRVTRGVDTLRTR